MYASNNYSKNRLLYTWIFLGVCLLSSNVQAKVVGNKKIKEQEKLVAIRLDAQEAQIIRQLMQQIELSTQELPIYLDICKPLDQITENQRDPQKKVILRLSPENAKNLMLFIQRANIPSLGAKQVDTILKKIQNSLNKEQTKNKTLDKPDDTLNLQLSLAEIQLLQQMLDQIDIAIAEVEPFLDVYLPLEQTNKQEKSPHQQEVTVRLPVVGPKNLLIFLERTTLTGSQAKKAYSVIDKLQQAMAISAGSAVGQP